MYFKGFIGSLLSRRASGQATVLVGLLVALGVLMGFVALAVDGGSALVQRRNMQNGADGAALGAAKTLAASVVYSGGVGTYTASNSDVVASVDQLLIGNRGGTITSPSYSSTVEYGTYVTASNNYSYSVLATYSNGSWQYSAPYTSTALAPATTDAVRVSTEEDSPTIFAALIGVGSIPVRGVAASALQNVPDYQANGPTWPMTRCAFPQATPPPGNGICNPLLFWSPNINDPNCNSHGNFKSLMQLGEYQGASYEGAHQQLLTQFDNRASMPEVTGSNGCGSGWTLWSPAGNCTDPVLHPPYGTACCSTNDNVADMDIANWIVNDFQGSPSLTSNWPSSYFRPSYTPPPGDWLETYNGGNLGNNISSYIQQYITTHGTSDDLAQYYGVHVDKVMYLNDLEETWDATSRQWLPTGPSQSPGRVHLSEAFRFRFYYQMADTGGFTTPASICGTSTSYNTSNSKVYGVFAGSEVSECPPGQSCGPLHGLNNYVDYIDP